MKSINKTPFQIMLIMLVLFSASCSKWEDQGESSVYAESIIIGDVTNMKVTQGKPLKRQYDIDGDGNIDFNIDVQITFKYQFPRFLIMEYSANTGCVIYHNSDTTYWYFDSIAGWPYTLCEKLPNSTRAGNVTEGIKMRPFELGDKISVSQIFQLGHSFTLLEDQASHKTGCFFPYDQEKYIGVMMKDGNSTRLGWIKLTVSRDFQVTVHEIAIQE